MLWAPSPESAAPSDRRRLRPAFSQLSLSFETLSRDTRAFAMAHRAQVPPAPARRYRGR